MKKIMIIFIILLLAGGCIFYFGWIQILLPAETYAVIFTKTGGYDSRVTEPGVFTWRWERLLPTNMQINKFDLRPYTKEITYSGTLPSGEQYASVLPDNPDFGFSVAVSLGFRINPRHLPRLVAEEKLTPETLNAYYEQTAESFAQAVSEYSWKYYSRVEEALKTGSGLFSIGNEKLKSLFSDRYPELEILSLKARVIKKPDPEMYTLAKESYWRLAQSREESRRAVASVLAEEQERVQAELKKEEAALAILKRYGELLTRYPVLLKAIYLQNLSGNEEIEIPDLQIPKIKEGAE